MTEHQLPIRPEYILESSGLPEENDGKLTALFSLPQRPTAIVASDDVLAMALERVVLSLGLRIPRTCPSPPSTTRCFPGWPARS